MSTIEPAPSRSSEGLAVSEYLRTRDVPLTALRAVLPRFSRARRSIDGLLRVLAAHSPAPPEGYEAWSLPRIAFTIDLLRGYVSPGSRVMDLASGSHFSLLVARSIPEIDWLPTDGETRGVEFRENRTGLIAYRYDPAHLMLAPGRVALPGGEPPDAVTLFEVLEHLPWNPSGLFGSVSDRLPVGGRLIVSTPNVCGRSPILQQLRGGTPHQTPFLKDGLWFHRKEYSPWELKQLYRWAGFEVEALVTANLYLADARGWRALVHHAALLGAAVLSASPVEVRHLWRHGGSTMFAVGRKVRPPRWDEPPPDM